MNVLLLPTLILGAASFVLGMRAWQRWPSPAIRAALLLLGVIAAIPGVVFDVYYLKLFHEPLWLYAYRSWSFAELTAGFAGFETGMLHAAFRRFRVFDRFAGSWFFPGILAMGLFAPYVKPIFWPPQWDAFQDRWINGVCLQTSDSSCGPACTATILRQFGESVTEAQIARDAFTSRSGTENWYLARELRRHGYAVNFLLETDSSKPWPYPAIAGVRISGTGHFITILDRVGDKYVIGDPIVGRMLRTQDEALRVYDFTGFFMVVH